MGMYVSAAQYSQQYYNRALKVRAMIRHDFDQAFDPGGKYQLDALLTPTTPTTAFPLGAVYGDSVLMQYADELTVPADHDAAPRPFPSPPVLIQTGCPSASSSSLRISRKANCCESQGHMSRRLRGKSWRKERPKVLGVKLSRSVIVLTLISLVSAACLIPQEMAAYVLPPTSTSTSTITNSPIPSLTPFQPQTLTAIPIGTASSTPAASLAASQTATITGTRTITLLPSSSITQTVQVLPTQRRPARLPPVSSHKRHPKRDPRSRPRKPGIPPVPTFTRTNGPSPTPTRSRTPAPTLTASPTVNGGSSPRVDR